MDSVPSKWSNRVNRAEREMVKVIQYHLQQSCLSLTLLSVTGRVYHVTIDSSGTVNCTCPYHCSYPQQLCKHIIFVIIHFYEIDNYYLSSEQKCLSFLHDTLLDPDPEPHPDLMADPKICDKYQHLQQQHTDLVNIRQNEICIICFEPINTGQETERGSLSQCDQCQNILHESCLTQWLSSSIPPLCPFCRAQWNNEQRETELINGIKYLHICSDK